MLNKVLVANRGEIAVRIVRACQELGIKTVAAFSEADRDSMAVRLADESVCIGPPPPAKSYLNPPALISAAMITGCDSVHPGYGFLSENPYFAEMCVDCNLKFIGPTAETMRLMGDKSIGRQTMRSAGVPTVPGSEGELRSVEEAVEIARQIGYPVLLKPSAGGGGRGMRVANDESDLVRAFPTARAEAEAAFGRGDLLLEKYLIKVRHVEIQVLADSYGHAIYLGERDCSAQRRHQKILEEAPSPIISPEVRAQMGGDALKGINKIGYVNAGTLEFLVDQEGNYYFIEMNTRIQVEHPVTELITGVDLVRWQLLIAAGERLTLQQKDIKIARHAVECRINAEDPERDFLPAGGEIEFYLPPGGPGVRVDSHIYAGYTPPGNYDSLLAKIITFGDTRDDALNRMRRALHECVITGIKTNIPFHLVLVDDPEFRAARHHTGYVAELLRRWKEERAAAVV
jgi:acetyl-CoA carboxylase, biotin carboxylase subunit